MVSPPTTHLTERRSESSVLHNVPTPCDVGCANGEIMACVDRSRRAANPGDGWPNPRWHFDFPSSSDSGCTAHTEGCRYIMRKTPLRSPLYEASCRRQNCVLSAVNVKIPHKRHNKFIASGQIRPENPISIRNGLSGRANFTQSMFSAFDGSIQ